MQPQDPTNPTGPAASEPPVSPMPPSPQPTQPSTGPSQPVTPPSPVSPGQPPAPTSFGEPTPAASETPFATPAAAPNNKKKLITMIVVIVAAVVVLAGIAFFAMKMLGGSITLKEYSNATLTVLVPAEYEQSETNGGVAFKEKTGDETSRSEIVALSQTFPEETTDTEIKAVKDQIKESLESNTTESVFNGTVEMKNIKVSDVTFKGSEAFKATGDAVKDGKKIGDVTMVAGVKGKTLFLVGVAAHESDKGLGKKTNDIINSFTLK